jgi:uncharacterized protein YkwD
MGVRFLAATAATQLFLIALCANASASAACPADASLPTSATTSDAARALACDVNVLRGEHGLRPLRWDWRLQAGAQRMADDMAARQYASHVTPEGARLVDRIRPTGYLRNSATWLLSENLGWGTNMLSTPLSIALGWMDSAPHRANILDPAMRHIGVGMTMGAITDGGETGAIYVADFGTRGTASSVRSRGRAGRSRRR